MEALLRRVAPLYHAVGVNVWSPLVSFSRTAVLSIFENLEVGRFEIVDTDGSKHLFGNVDSAYLRTLLKVHKDTFWVRLLLFADMVRCATPSGNKHPRF